MKTLIAVLGTLLLAATAAAQGNAIAQALATEAKTNETNMVSAAEAMPAEKYGFKPTPQQNSFGELIYHAAVANNLLCGLMSGEKAPEAPVQGDGPKAALVDQMKASFAFCYKAFDKVDAARLGESVRFMTRDVSLAWVALHTALDWGDHYAQVATMLRLNGIIPPSAQRRAR